MEKVLQALIIPKALSDEDTTKALEGYRTDEVKDYETFKSYIQVGEDEMDPESIEVVLVDKENHVFGVVGILKAESKTQAKALDAGIKTVDFVTMDNLYTELYAMADIVSGAMRQENADNKFRTKTILTAIDNFKTFAEAVLANLKSATAIDPAKFPNLAHPLVTVPKKDKVDEPGGDKVTIEDQIKNMAAESKKVMDTLTDLVGKMGTEVKDLTTKVGAIQSYTDTLKTTLKNDKTQVDVDVNDPNATKGKGGVFEGLFLKKQEK